MVADVGHAINETYSIYGKKHYAVKVAMHMENKMTDHPKIINEIWQKIGMATWIKFIPTQCELEKKLSPSSLASRAYREGFKAGAEVMKELATKALATKAAETVIENERVGRN